MAEVGVAVPLYVLLRDHLEREKEKEERMREREKEKKERERARARGGNGRGNNESESERQKRKRESEGEGKELEREMGGETGGKEKRARDRQSGPRRSLRMEAGQPRWPNFDTALSAPRRPTQNDCVAR